MPIDDQFVCPARVCTRNRNRAWSGHALGTCQCRSKSLRTLKQMSGTYGDSLNFGQLFEIGPAKLRGRVSEVVRGRQDQLGMCDRDADKAVHVVQILAPALREGRQQPSPRLGLYFDDLRLPLHSNRPSSEDVNEVHLHARARLNVCNRAGGPDVSEGDTSVFDHHEGPLRRDRRRAVFVGGGDCACIVGFDGRSSTSVQALGSSPMGWPAFMASPRRAAFMSRWWWAAEKPLSSAPSFDG